MSEEPPSLAAIKAAIKGGPPVVWEDPGTEPVPLRMMLGPGGLPEYAPRYCKSVRCAARPYGPSSKRSPLLKASLCGPCRWMKRRKLWENGPPAVVATRERNARLREAKKAARLQGSGSR